MLVIAAYSDIAKLIELVGHGLSFNKTLTVLLEYIVAGHG